MSTMLDTLRTSERILPKALAFVLRNRELWPEGFVWDYRSFDNCAMGLAVEIFNLNSDQNYNYKTVGRSLGITNSQARDVFLDIKLKFKWKFIPYFSREDFTPEEIAAKLEKL